LLRILLLRILLLLVVLLLKVLLLLVLPLLLLQVSSFFVQNLSGGWRRFGKVAHQLALASSPLKIVDNITI
jgi:hypothetical protein